ncbi:MAG: MarR family transcriptional regulator [Deltaproteobacteria bacterium]|nr:MarR family transcriptional regulator [Deltaproteobacteria bacterium]
MDKEIKDIINVMEKLDAILFSKFQRIGKRLSMKDPFSELTNTQLQAVFKISKICPCTLSDVAKTLRISKSSASTLVERMVIKGVLERKQDPDNRRRVLITVTRQVNRFQKTIDEELIKELKKIATEMLPEDFNKWVEANKAIDSAIDNIYES